MATRRPRITVTLTDEDYQVLQRLSAVNGESMSGIVSSLVSAVSPALTRVADLAEAAVGAMPDVLDGLQRAAQKGEDLLTPAFTASLAAWDEAMTGLEDALGAPTFPPLDVTDWTTEEIDQQIEADLWAAEAWNDRHLPEGSTPRPSNNGGWIE